MKDSEHTLFLRKNSSVVSHVIEAISQDIRLMNMLLSQDVHLLRYFLTSLLNVGLSADDGIHPKILIMFANATTQIIDPDTGKEAFDIIMEHVKQQEVSMSSTVQQVLRMTLVKSLTSSKKSAPLSKSSILQASFISPTLLSMDSDIYD